VASTYAPAPVRTRPPPARFVTAGRVVDATGMFRDYEVQRHDHVDAVARDLGTTRAVIVEANHLTAPYAVHPGQHLKVPVAKAYEAEAGDTLPLVAKRFDVAADDLAQLNDLPVRGRLKQGERIALPTTFHDQGPTRLRAPVEEVRAAAPAPRPVPTPTPYRAYASAGPSTAPRSAPYVPPASYAPPTPRPSPTPYIAHPYTPSSPSAYANAQRPAYAPIAPPTVEATRPASDTEIASAARGRFIWPVRGEILSGFGSKGVGRRNDGVDVKSPQGTVVHAAAGGDVVYAGNQEPGFGNLVLVKHADGWVTAYAHLDKVSVQMRQAVIQGQEIGQVGLSGGVVEPELHFEVRYAPTPADKARPVDPMLVLPKLAG
jgi:murein DD-endopeptidase MepM/ murein hydrolase activator NlpD